jgi:S1-C subfamily serine protease
MAETQADKTDQKPKRVSPIIGIVLLILMGLAMFSGVYADRMGYLKNFDAYLPKALQQKVTEKQTVDLSQKVLTEESVVIDVAEKASPSVVTVSISTKQSRQQSLFMDPFGFFGQGQQMMPQPPEQVKQDIGSGFVVDGSQGLIVTNKHVVSATDATYTVITKDDKEYQVQKIYRDPVNDLAILKVDAELPSLEVGDSDKLKVGQFVIAIGTALGEFRHTVTTGVVSGLGRGIDAGDGFSGAAERLDNVIQTDAAINPGNSGGPLINSAGQVIGVNVAISQQGQNIGFALPINVVTKSLENFNTTGQFDRPFLGVKYRMIPKETALMNDVPEGAYIVEVVADSAADKAGVKQGDIIVKLDGKNVKEADGGLAEIINTLKPDQTVKAEIFRDGQTKEVDVTLKLVEQ